MRGVRALTEKEQDIKTRGLVLILKELHDKLDALVARAYGWPDDLSDNDILERLVALNHERAAEERGGKVRWLRPEYQIAKFGAPTEKEQVEAKLAAPRQKAKKPSLPANELEAITTVMHVLSQAGGPMSIAGIAAIFRQTKNIDKKVGLIVMALARLGHLDSPDGDETFTLRKAA